MDDILLKCHSPYDFANWRKGLKVFARLKSDETFI